jgi:hypothetical protein
MLVIVHWQRTIVGQSGHGGRGVSVQLILYVYVAVNGQMMVKVSDCESVCSVRYSLDSRWCWDDESMSSRPVLVGNQINISST